MIGWHPGDRVICVDASPAKDGWFPDPPLAVGEEYRLVAVGYPKDLAVRPPDLGNAWNEGLCVVLDGMSGPHGKGPGGLVMFRASRFRRAVDSRKAEEVLSRVRLVWET